MDAAELRALIAKHGSIRAVERSGDAGMSERSIRRRLKESSYSTDPLPDEIDVEVLLARRIEEFQQRAMIDRLAKWHTVRLNENKPIGLGFIGDLHLDNNGTNIALAFEHAKLFNGSIDGLHAGFIGDIWDNWPERMSRLWAETSVDAKEAQALVQHYLDTVQLLFAVLGNHDLYAGKEDLLTRMMTASVDRVSKHAQKVKLVFPNGREVRILARHSFPGNSQWVTQFGAVKAAQLNGSCDIYVAGHTHVSGYSHGWHDGSERMWHALQVASYKAIDDYAAELGLAKRDIYQCPVAIIDPNAAQPTNFIRWQFDPFEGAKYLTWLRSRA